jgi:hypothetical protein
VAADVNDEVEEDVLSILVPIGNKDCYEDVLYTKREEERYYWQRPAAADQWCFDANVLP